MTFNSPFLKLRFNFFNSESLKEATKGIGIKHTSLDLNSKLALLPFCENNLLRLSKFKSIH